MNLKSMMSKVKVTHCLDQFEYNQDLSQVQNQSDRKHKELQLYSYEIQGCYGPPTLYGAAMLAVGPKLYLYGGKCSAINGAVYEFNINL